MDILILAICSLSFLWWLELAVEWWVAGRLGENLSDLPPGQVSERSGGVTLSVIIPARDEGAALPEALASVMAALPPGGEAILVDDRSSDDTGLIASGIARSDHRLKVLRIRDVPEDWLGKNHALQKGFEEASGTFLLFTDADVVFQPGCLARALALCERDGLDHLVATPRVITVGFWERVFVPFFSILLVSRYRIWRASVPGSPFYAGIGAFNMVRRGAYERAGTHAALKNEVVDDLMLGKLMKKTGGRQGVVSAERCVSVRWHEGITGLVTGLEKNAYAAFEFKPVRTLFGCLGLLAVTWIPFFASLLYRPGLRGLLGISAIGGYGVWLSFAALYGLAARGTGASWLYFVTFPAGSFLMVWAIVRSAVLYHLRGGVKWRGTIYKGPRSKVQGPK
ncbi:MAG: glycosyltransferase family 2 protein [bacterium]|nr:glycosyltransferase family 2 protein [bacterium]MDT8396872.1 glycosyltransferase family 2 protein [bacterium]